MKRRDRFLWRSNSRNDSIISLLKVENPMTGDSRVTPELSSPAFAFLSADRLTRWLNRASCTRRASVTREMLACHRRIAQYAGLMCTSLPPFPSLFSIPSNPAYCGSDRNIPRTSFPSLFRAEESTRSCRLLINWNTLEEAGTASPPILTLPLSIVIHVRPIQGGREILRDRTWSDVTVIIYSQLRYVIAR